MPLKSGQIKPSVDEFCILRSDDGLATWATKTLTCHHILILTAAKSWLELGLKKTAGREKKKNSTRGNVSCEATKSIIYIR